jgi:hypothetical protein
MIKYINKYAKNYSIKELLEKEYIIECPKEEHFGTGIAYKTNIAKFPEFNPNIIPSRMASAGNLFEESYIIWKYINENQFVAKFTNIEDSDNFPYNIFNNEWIKDSWERVSKQGLFKIDTEDFKYKNKIRKKIS